MSKWFSSLAQNLVVSIAVAALVMGLSGLLNVVPNLTLSLPGRVLLSPPWVFVLFVAVGVSLALAIATSGFSIWDYRLGRICRQFQFFSYIDRFASNGLARYRFVRKDGLVCVELDLQNEETRSEIDPSACTTSADCGVTFAKKVPCRPLTRGFRISDKIAMRFQLMGRAGCSQIGLALKNTGGHEQKIPLASLIGDECRIEPNGWRAFEVGLDRFARVVDGQYRSQYLENFSFFTNSNLSATERLTFYVRGISSQKRT